MWQKCIRVSLYQLKFFSIYYSIFVPCWFIQWKVLKLHFILSHQNPEAAKSWIFWTEGSNQASKRRKVLINNNNKGEIWSYDWRLSACLQRSWEFICIAVESESSSILCAIFFLFLLNFYFVFFCSASRWMWINKARQGKFFTSTLSST